MVESPQFIITFMEMKSDEYLGKVAGTLLGMEHIREIHKLYGNTQLVCIVTSRDAINFDKVDDAASAAKHTIT